MNGIMLHRQSDRRSETHFTVLFTASLRAVNNHCHIQAASCGESQLETGRRRRQTGGLRLAAQSTLFKNAGEKQKLYSLDTAAIIVNERFSSMVFIVPIQS